ncbi:MAG TPA: citrate lyase acyl carrier protein [Thermoanaerobacterales bacterium]|nr:citrate lyase acyl carrier protein [Thermoanaerobacterales bacterium]
MISSKAGTEEKNDCIIEMEPLNKGEGIKIEIESPIRKQFGRHIRNTVMEVLKERGIEDVKVRVIDKKALEFTIRARMETAIERSGGEKSETSANTFVCAGK